mgnify:CR=1 FL=1|tara:strand:- start:1301 stop:1624 length:324 start_codon:yes stop_codon:yes gene_type:complete
MSSKARVYVQENNEGIPPHLRRFIVIGIAVIPAADSVGMPKPPGTHPFIVENDAAALIAALSNPAEQFSTHEVTCTDGKAYPVDPRKYTASEILRELGDFVLVPLKK